MKRSWLLLIILFISNLLLGQQVYQQKVLDLVSLDFPAKPNFSDTLGRKVYVYKGDSAFLMLIVTEVASDPAFRIKEGELDKTYDGFLQGMLQSAKGTLVEKKKVKIDGSDAIDLEYTVDAPPGMPDRRFERLLFLNGRFFNCDFWTTSSLKEATVSSRQKFFSSFTILADQKKRSQEQDTGFQQGYVFGKYILSPLLIIALIALPVYFIVRRNKRRK